MAVNRIYCATGLTGGTTGDLDTIDGADLADKDMAIVCDQTTFYFYVLDADSAAAESSPDVISPDDNPGDKRWILQSGRFNDLTLSDDIILATDDVTVGDALEVKGSAQIGDADGTGANLTIYSNTSGDHVVFDKTAKTATFTDIQIVANNVDINGGAIDGTTIGAASQAAGDFTAIGAVSAGTIVGTTIDATTDFTVGGTVITDGYITDDGTLYLKHANGGAVSIVPAAADNDVNLYVGSGETYAGTIWLGSDNTGIGSTGGRIISFVAEDSDGNGTDYFIQQVTADDFHIGADNDTSMLQFLGGATPSIVISAGWTAAGETCADLGSVTTADINGGTIDGVTIGGAVAPTVTDLGSVATCDINGGAIDGTAIGAANPSTGAFTTVTVTDITVNDTGEISFDSTPASDDTGTGLIVTETVDANATGIGALLVKSSDGNWDEADADAVTTVGQLGIALEAGTGSKKILLWGFIKDTAWSWTVGSQLFVHTTAGAMSHTAPSGSGDYVQCVGYAWASDTVFFNPSPDYIEVA